MDVSLLRAVLHMARNHRKGSTRRGLAVFLGVSALPMAALLFWLGYQFGDGLALANAALAGQAAAGLILFLGCFSGLSDGTCVLRFETLRPFQVPPFSAFQAEIMVGLLTPMKMYLGCLAALGGLGLAVNHPSLLPWLLVFIPMALIWLFCLERLVGVLGRLVGRNLKTLVLFGALVILFRLAVRDELGPGGSWMPLECLRGRIAFWLPTTQSIVGWQGVLVGHGALSKLLLLPCLWTLVLLTLTFGALRKTFAGHSLALTQVSTHSASFKRPWVGVAMLHWRDLWHSKVGRLFIFVPLVALNGMMLPFVIEHRPGPTWIVAWIGWMQLIIGNGFLFDVFGLDRGGIRSFWTLPLEDLDLLVGKVVGLGCYQAALLLLLAGCLPFFAPLNRQDSLAALFFCGAIFFAHARSGLRFSIEHARFLDPEGLNPNEPNDLFFLQIGKAILPFALLVAIWVLARPFGPWALVLTMAFACCAALVHFVLGLPGLCACLSSQRDHLTATLETR